MKMEDAGVTEESVMSRQPIIFMLRLERWGDVLHGVW